MLEFISIHIEWIFDNKECLFSGIGVFVLSLLIAFLLWVKNVRQYTISSGNAKQFDENGQKRIRRTNYLALFYLFILSIFRRIVKFPHDVYIYYIRKNCRRKRNLYQKMSEPTVFFSERFAEAFPGCRGVLKIDDPAEAVRRLDILLRAPLAVKVECGSKSFGINPIWWFRGGHSLPIKEYRRLRKNLVFRTRDIKFNGVELHRVRRVVAFGSMAYWANVVYVETDGVEPSGLYAQGLSEYANRRGYEYEEVGVYKSRFITGEEYDDGSATINGKVVKIRGKAKLEMRYLSEYNFFITSVMSPVNETKYDGMLQKAFNAVLQGEISVENLAETIAGLPRNPREDWISQRAQENLAKF